LRTVVAGKIVQNDDVTPVQRGGELGLYVGLEAHAVHRSTEDPRRIQTVVAQGGDEGLGAPVAEGRMVDEPFPPRRPSAGLAHVGLQGRLVDEAETGQETAHEGLAPEDPALSGLAHIRPLLLNRAKIFFYMSGQDVEEDGRRKS